MSAGWYSCHSCPGVTWMERCPISSGNDTHVVLETPSGHAGKDSGRCYRKIHPLPYVLVLLFQVGLPCWLKNAVVKQPPSHGSGASRL